MMSGAPSPSVAGHRSFLRRLFTRDVASGSTLVEVAAFAAERKEL